ncbi:membrane-bound lytic murein transglycosylase MltF [Ferrimonas lipolytica]|uniref:membrane-bound lytic murein transglycosylase MltF n=1 Tax=Ferrimonas lipolytica TaxID=2724191 RepID=UPI001EEA09FA|nr:membrane-bound lytic murein transglycosylase MltF [Ferrimonas lipolytica]
MTSSLLVACVEIAEPITAESPQKPIVVRFGTLSSPASYQLRNQNPIGIDYELAKEFGEYVDVPIKITPFTSLETLFDALQNHEIDIIAAGLTRTALREQQWIFGPPLYEVTPVVVHRQNHRSPKSLAEISGDITVVKGSNHAELLHQFQRSNPNFQWQQSKQLDTQQLLRQVANHELKYTVTDSTSLALAQRYYPSLRQGLEIGDSESVAWALDKERDPWLISAMLEFWNSELRTGRLQRLEDKYFGHVQRFDYVDTMAFIRAVESRLPKYKAMFQRYAGDIDWRRFAAISYQESHWNPKAKSPTGVRGMMMLTQPTARRMNVTNRLDPEQSIRGGSNYLKQLIRRLPKSIPEDEKGWFALAAYNIGLGHLEDARVITQRAGKDPNSWRDVKKHLPLLRQKEYYQKTRYGYARGDEAVHYVDNIRRYYDTLVWLDSQQAPQGEPERHLDTPVVPATAVAPE